MPERIREGIRRLAAVVDAELEIQATFGSDGRATGSMPTQPLLGDAPTPDLT